jgi:hypothetical protein
MTMRFFSKSILIFSIVLNGVLGYFVLALKEEVAENKAFMQHAEEEAREQRIQADEQMKMAAMHRDMAELRQRETEAVRKECERHLAVCRKR